MQKLVALYRATTSLTTRSCVDTLLTYSESAFHFFISAQSFELKSEQAQSDETDISTIVQTSLPFIHSARRQERARLTADERKAE